MLTLHCNLNYFLPNISSVTTVSGGKGLGITRTKHSWTNEGETNIPKKTGVNDEAD